MKAFLQKSNSLEPFVKLFNSEAAMEHHFPKTYEAYQNTKNAKPDLKAAKREEYYDIEILHVGYADDKKDRLSVILNAQAHDDQGYCILAGSFQNRKSHTAIVPSVDTNFIGNNEMTQIMIPLENCAPDDILLTAQLYTVDDHVIAYEWQGYLSGFLTGYTSALHLEAPIISHLDKENKDINIAYYWKSGFSSASLDYYYSHRQMPEGNLHIPSKGAITVEGIRIDTVASCTLMAFNAKGDTYYHMNASATALDSQTISWDIPDDWGFPATNIVKDLYEYVTYTLTISALCAGKKATFIVTNMDAAPAKNRFPIPKIYVYRDCFTEGTKIAMKDKTEKNAEDIKEGDQVLCRDGSCSTVQSVMHFEGFHPLAHVVLEDSTELFVTANHPLMTKNGFQCAFMLQEGQEVMTTRGYQKIAQLCASPNQRCDLISIGLSDQHQLFANGILAADSSTEASETAKATNLRYQVAQEWRADYDGWQMMDQGEIVNG